MNKEDKDAATTEPLEMQHVTLRIVGTRAEIDDFTAELTEVAESEIRLLSTNTLERSSLDEPRFGHREILEVLIDFSLNIGASAAYAALLSSVQKLRKRRRGAAVEEVSREPAADERARSVDGDEGEIRKTRDE